MYGFAHGRNFLGGTALYWGEGLEGVRAGRASDVQSGPLYLVH